MKKILSLCMVAVMALALSGCAEPRQICGTKYKPYGVFDADENRNPDISYEVSIGSVILGVIFIETIFVPVIAWGFYLYEPVGLKGQKGVINPTCEKGETRKL